MAVNSVPNALIVARHSLNRHTFNLARESQNRAGINVPMVTRFLSEFVLWLSTGSQVSLCHVPRTVRYLFPRVPTPWASVSQFCSAVTLEVNLRTVRLRIDFRFVPLTSETVLPVTIRLRSPVL